jgi:hypothetical protein
VWGLRNGGPTTCRDDSQRLATTAPPVGSFLTFLGLDLPQVTGAMLTRLARTTGIIAPQTSQGSFPSSQRSRRCSGPIPDFKARMRELHPALSASRKKEL